MGVVKESWLHQKRRLSSQFSARLAGDLPDSPEKWRHSKRSQSAYMNWSDLRAFSDALSTVLPDLVFFPSVYIGGGLNMEAAPDGPVPIYRSFVDCIKDPTHGVIVVVSIRWPWADELTSGAPDVLAGRITGNDSPWFEEPWRLPTKWSRMRRAGRRVSITVHFRGYECLQNIEQWQGKLFWGAERDEDGRRFADAIPESWIFRDASACVLSASYVQEDVDRAFFCELILDLWRKYSTDIRGSFDARTGEVLTPEHKNYEARYGWNTLKHGLSGSRHFLTITPDQKRERFYAYGPAIKQIKKAELSQDLEAFDAYDFVYPRQRLPLQP